MFKRLIKGDHDYLHNKKIRVIVLTIIYFAISLGIILIGYLTTGTKRNLLTVVGILGCLPACKSAVSMIMYIKAKGCSDELFKLTDPFKDKLLLMYDMYFTSYKKDFPISVMVVKNNKIIGVSEKMDLDTKACTEHLLTYLNNGGHKNCVVTVVTDSDKYIEMLNNLSVEEEDENSLAGDEAIRRTLYEISL